MEITEETLHASIATTEQQLAKAMAEADMCRGAIVMCNQLLLHLEAPEPPLTSETDEESPTQTFRETGVGQTVVDGFLMSRGEEEARGNDDPE